MDDRSVLILEHILWVLLFIVPTWKIFSRAGLRPALSLLMFVPGIGWLIVSLMLSFMKWPAIKPTQ